MEQSILITLPLHEFVSTIEATIRKVFTEQDKPSDILLTSEEVMKMFSISTTTLQTWRDKKKIPYERIGKKIYYSRAALLAFNTAKQN